FDATAGGVYNTVSGGSLTVGVAGAGGGAGASGFVLANPLGDLSFTSMNVFADNGTALKISGASAVNDATPAGFRLVSSSGTGTISAVNGPAIDISGGTVNLVPASISSTGTPATGVSLLNVADGTIASVAYPAIVNLASGTITGATTAGFKVDGGSATITYGGSIKANG